MIIVKKNSSLILFLFLILLFVGCGNSDLNSGSSNTPPSPSTPTTISGFVIDGPLQNAIVFLDIDNDGERDTNEPYANTDSQGKYTLNVNSSDLSKYKLIAEITENSVDMDDNEKVVHPYILTFFDSSTKNALSGYLEADSFSLNPFTTMVQSEIETGVAPDDAVKSVASHLGLLPKYHHYLLANYVKAKESKKINNVAIDDAGLTVINRLHNIARTTARVLGQKIKEVSDYAKNQNVTLNAKQKGYASSLILDGLKVKLKGVANEASTLNKSRVNQEVSEFVKNMSTATIYNAIKEKDFDKLLPNIPVITSKESVYKVGDAVGINWKMFFGENGTTAKLVKSFYNPKASNADKTTYTLATKTLTPNTPNAQEDSFSVNLDKGVYKLKVCLSNSNGEACSSEFVVTVNSTGGRSDFPLKATGEAKKRPGVPTWDGWMQNVKKGGFVEAGKYYGAAWSKWSGLIADTYTHKLCTKDASSGNYTCEDVNYPAGTLNAVSQWDHWEGGKVIGKAGGQTAKYSVGTLDCVKKTDSNSVTANTCYYLDENGIGKGLAYYHQVQLCRIQDGANHCSVSDILEIKVVKDSTIPSNAGSTTSTDTNVPATMATKTEAIEQEPTPEGVTEDATIKNNTGGVVSGEARKNDIPIAAPSVKYVEGSWQPFKTTDAVKIGLVKYWGKVGDKFNIYAQGPSTSNTIDRTLAKTSIGTGNITASNYKLSDEWSTEITHQFGQEGFYVITGELCTSDNKCVSSSNEQIIEVSNSSTTKTVIDNGVTAKDTTSTKADSVSSVVQETKRDKVTILSGEEYSKIEQKLRSDKLKQAIKNITTLTLDKHKFDSNGIDLGPDLDNNSFANVNRIKSIFVERYDKLFAKGLVTSAVGADNQAETAWNWLFPLANGDIKMNPGNYASDVANGKYPYTFTNFLKAAAKYPAFCGDSHGSYVSDNADTLCKKSLAAMFSHFTQEVGAHLGNPVDSYTYELNGTVYSNAPSNDTKMKNYTCNSYSQSKGLCSNGTVIPEWRQGLYWINECGCSESGSGCEYRSCNPGTWQAEAWPCPNNTKYFGRGPKQLSYNYNYGPFSEIIYGDVNVLLKRPEQVTEGWLAFASAVYFYMQPRPPKPSMFEVVYGYWDPSKGTGNLGNNFGSTIMIINGGIECGGTVPVAQASNRVKYYFGYMDYFGLQSEINVSDPKVASLSCANMSAFDSIHGASYPTYWEKSWSTPGTCQLVTYETPFSGFMDGHYKKCVKYNFE